VPAEDLPDWERLLAAERHLQSLVPGAVLVGGTAAALHAGTARASMATTCSRTCASASTTSSLIWKRPPGGGHHGSSVRSFDELYAQDSGASPCVEVVERLGAAEPSDRAEVDLATYKGLLAPWNDWSHLAARGRHWAGILARGRLTGGTP
jgi:hypothetical protein